MHPLRRGTARTHLGQATRAASRASADQWGPATRWRPSHTAGERGPRSPSPTTLGAPAHTPSPPLGSESAEGLRAPGWVTPRAPLANCHDAPTQRSPPVSQTEQEDSTAARRPRTGSRVSPPMSSRAAPGSLSTSAGDSEAPGSLGPPPRAARGARARVSRGGTGALRRASRAALALHRRVCARCAGTSRGSALSSGPVSPGPRGPWPLSQRLFSSDPSVGPGPLWPSPQPPPALSLAPPRSRTPQRAAFPRVP